MKSGWKMALCGAALALAALPARTQEVYKQETPAYKCGPQRYTDVPCPGGREVGAPPARSTERHRVPPQDRARLARRAELAPEARQECDALDTRLRDLQLFVQSRGEAVTADEERPLVQGRLRYRELRC